MNFQNLSDNEEDKNGSFSKGSSACSFSDYFYVDLYSED